MQEGESNRLEVIDKRDSSSSVNEHPLDKRASNSTEVSLDLKLYKGPSPSESSIMDELVNDAVWDVCFEVVSTESLLDELLDDAMWDVCFEVHRSAKLGYFFLDSPTQEPIIVEDAEKDIHGQALKSKAQNFQIPCPICKHKSCATKFASHLAKCIGISGRNSSRAASQKIADLDENKYDYDSDSSMNSNKKRTKKNQGKKNARKKSKLQGNSVPKSSIDINASYKDMTHEQRKTFFNQMCGVVSKRTSKMCMNTHKCSAHTDEERRDVRHYLLSDMGDQLANDGQIDVDTVDEGSAGLSLFMQSLSTCSAVKDVTPLPDFIEKQQPSSSKNSAACFKKKKTCFGSSSSASSPSHIAASGSSFDSL